MSRCEDRLGMRVHVTDINVRCTGDCRLRMSSGLRMAIVIMRHTPILPMPGAGKLEPPPLSGLLRSRMQALTGEPPTVGDLLQLLGDRSIAGLLLMLALPMALPVPAPGMSIPLGVAMVMVAAQMAIGRRHAWLPRFLLRRPLRRKIFERLSTAMIAVLVRMERFIKPRGKWMLPHWVAFPVGVVCLLLALLVALPIPLSNAMPGAAIVLLSLGLLERDGLVVWIGLLVSVLSIAAVILASNGLYDASIAWWKTHA